MLLLIMASGYGKRIRGNLRNKLCKKLCKKLVSSVCIIVTVIVLSLSFFTAGCEDAAKTTAGADVAETSAGADVAETSAGADAAGTSAGTDTGTMVYETVTICFSGGMIGPDDDGLPKNKAVIGEMLDALNAKAIRDIGIKAEFIWLPYDSQSTYEDTLLEKLRCGELAPDAFQLSTKYLRKFGDEGLVRDLSFLLLVNAPDYYASILEFGGSSDLSYRYYDKIHAIPNNNVFSQRYCVVAREDLVERYSPDGIESLDDYYEFLSAVKEKERNIEPGSITSQGWEFIEAYMQGNGYYGISSCVVGRFDDDKITPVLIYDTKEFDDACGLYRKIMELGVERHLLESVDIMDGNIASAFDRISAFQKNQNSFICKYGYRMYPLYLDSPMIRYSRTDRILLCISQYSQKAEGVLKFMEWLHSDRENYELLMYGIKDKHYKLSGEYVDLTRIDSDKQVQNWMGSGVFTNYLYERLFPYEPEDYIGFRRECASANVMTREELSRMKGYSYRDRTPSEIKLFKNTIEPEEICFNEYMEFLRSIEMAADESRTLKQVIEEKGLQDAFDVILGYYNERVKNTRSCFVPETKMYYIPKIDYYSTVTNKMDEKGKEVMVEKVIHINREDEEVEVEYDE